MVKVFKDFQIKSMNRGEFFPLMAKLQSEIFSDDLSYNPDNILSKVELESMGASMKHFKIDLNISSGI